MPELLIPNSLQEIQIWYQLGHETRAICEETAWLQETQNIIRAICDRHFLKRIQKEIFNVAVYIA